MPRCLIVAAALTAACGASQQPQATARQPLPALDLSTMEGSRWQPPADRVLVIDVWASWCKPCRKGFPLLDALASRRTDVAFVAISIDEERDAVDAFLRDQPVALPIALDPDQTVTRPPLAIQRVPTLLVVDATGAIRHRLEEPSAADYQRLEQLIDGVQSP
jgi:thiol-disulfide isomerase/thioredoxin